MIFLDTTFIIAYILKNERNHEKANKIFNELEKETLYINNTILVEVLNSFKNNRYDVDVDEIFQELTQTYNLVYLDEKDYLDALNKLKFYKQSINYSDCTVLSSMEKLGIHGIATFDSDFEGKSGIYTISEIEQFKT